MGVIKADSFQLLNVGRYETTPVMPSAKPDRSEVLALRKKLELFPFRPLTNLFSDLFFECRTAIQGGYIDRDRAERLLAYLEANEHVSNVFPNCVLRDLTRSYVEANENELEARLLGMLVDMYAGDPRESRVPIGVSIGMREEGAVTVEELSAKSNPEYITPPGDIQDSLSSLIAHDASLYGRVFDSLPTNFSFPDRFFAFTGPFAGSTRRACYEEVRRRGGVPCEPTFYCDYLFVSDSHIQDQVLSSSSISAIAARRTCGSPLILRETDWHIVIAE